MKNKSRAFTLIELLVVVLIIGILAAVALPQYQKAVMKARYTQLKVLTHAIANAQEVYYLANNQYSARFDELDVNSPAFNRQITTSNENTRYFSWGSCWVVAASEEEADPRVACEYTSENLTYYVSLQHGTASPGARRCRGNSKIANALCKAETNDSSKSVSDALTYWTYQ